jgi:hypothetical protein
MTDDRSVERAARSWLDEGPTEAPDRAVEAALLRIQTTSQERDLRIPWRVRSMSLLARLAAAAIAIAVVVGGGALILRPGGTSVGGPVTPTPSAAPTGSTSRSAAASPAPSPTAALQTLHATESGTLAPGAYRVDDFAVPFTVNLPAGWINQGYKPHSFALRNDNAFLALVVVEKAYPDPCHLETAPSVVKPGVNGLVTAFRSMAGFHVGDLRDATVGGARGKGFTLSNAIDLHADGCTRSDVLWIGRDGDDAPVLETAGGSDSVFVVDVSGTTILIGGPADVVGAIAFDGLTN